MRMKATLDELLCSVELLEGDTAILDVINKHISDQTEVSDEMIVFCFFYYCFDVNFVFNF